MRYRSEFDEPCSVHSSDAEGSTVSDTCQARYPSAQTPGRCVDETGKALLKRVSNGLHDNPHSSILVNTERKSSAHLVPLISLSFRTMHASTSRRVALRAQGVDRHTLIAT